MQVLLSCFAVLLFASSSTFGQNTISGPDISCYDCVQGYEPGCQPIDTEAADKNFLRDCKKNPPEQVKLRKDAKVVGCRKIEQEVEGAITVVRQCAYEGDEIKQLKRVGNKGVRMFYWQCTDDKCNAAGNVAASLLVIVIVSAFAQIFLAPLAT